MSYLETKSQKLQDKISNSPKDPGCYMYVDQAGTIIYVGKAKNIRNRVKSYFVNYSKLDIKVQAMLEHAVDVNFVTVDSEVEALILESNLIKKYHPKYNIVLRDDKSYSWIKVEKPIKGVRDFPKIRIVRSTDIEKSSSFERSSRPTSRDSEYFGPYPSTLPLKNILVRIRKVFPYVSCNRRLIQINDNPLEVDTNNSVPCLYYHLGLCPAPCANLIDKKTYMKNFNNIKKFLKGEKNDILHELEDQMNKYSKNMQYEEAAKTRDKINDIKYVTRNISIDNDIDDVVITELKESERSNALNQLIEELQFPKDKLKYHPGFKIECYDISNIQGTNAVGSMTVMVDGQLRKDLYRKFRIKMKNEPNDFAMLQEVLSRRFSHILNPVIQEKAEVHEAIDQTETEKDIDQPDPSFSVKPDLIIIDGGKGQLASTYKILKKMGLDNEIPIVGLAKREEEIFKVQWQFTDSDLSSSSWAGTFLEDSGGTSSTIYDDNGAKYGSNTLGIKRFKRIFLTRKTEALYLVQRIRDEAHRFGITYHRKLRSKQMLNKLTTNKSIKNKKK